VVTSAATPAAGSTVHQHPASTSFFCSRIEFVWTVTHGSVVTTSVPDR
jgi:hypothetical protein